MLFIKMYGIQMLHLPCLCNELLQYLDEVVCWAVTLSSKFGAAFHSREKNLLYMYYTTSRLNLMMRFPKQSFVGEKTEKSLLSVDVDNTDNRLKHDREMEIGEPTSKTLKKLRQE